MFIDLLDAYRCLGGPRDGTFATLTHDQTSRFTDEADVEHTYRMVSFRPSIAMRDQASVRRFLVHNTMTGTEAAIVISCRAYL